MERFLYLTTTGRTTGLPRTIEIWFVEVDGRFYIVSEMREASKWVKNIRREPAVSFRVGARDEATPTTAATARVVTDGALLARVTAAMDAKYGWSDGLVVEIAPAGEVFQTISSV